MTSHLVRLVGLALGVLLIPACSRDRKVAPMLLNEGFNGGFPGTSWTAPVLTGSATAAIDSASGFPAPSLEMTATAATATVTTDTVSAFNNPNVTISVHLANLSTATTELGTGTVAILDSTPAVVASASWDNATGLITFHINGGAPDATVAAAADGNFHRVLFNVSSSGTATWSFDSGATLVAQAGFPAGMVKVRLGATFGTGTAWPAFSFDNVTVTSP